MRRRGRSTAWAAVSLLVVAACFTGADPGELSVYGPYVGREADVFGQVLAEFTEETGITVNYVGSASFDSDFDDRVTSGDLADVTILPQPALLASLVDEGVVGSLGPDPTQEIIDTVGPEWAALVAPGGDAFGVPYRFVVKSIVWYRPDVFEESGYEVPTTMGQLAELSDRMIRNGHTPWCAGMDSSVSTGWWATDWIEDLVARRSGVDTYWSWASLETPFTDAAVVSAMEEFQEIMTAEGSVAGGRRAILNIRVEDAMDPMFEDEPGCLMHKQASFQPVWLPANVEVGDGTLDIFPLPGVTDEGPPVILSGELAVATSDNPAASEFLLFLLSDAAFEPWRAIGGSLVARAERAPSEMVEHPLDRRLVEILEGAGAALFDGSDLMPVSVGSEAFFAGMIDLVAGAPAAEVAGRIQAAVDELNEDQ